MTLHDELETMRGRAEQARPEPGGTFVPKDALRRSQADVARLLALLEPVEVILSHSDDEDIDLLDMATGCVCDVCNIVYAVSRVQKDEL